MHIINIKSFEKLLLKTANANHTFKIIEFCSFGLLFN